MPYEVKYNQETECVVAKFVGVLDAGNIAEYAGEAIRVMGEHECRRLLNDLRGANLDFSLMKVYFGPDRLRGWGFQPTWKRAILITGGLTEYTFFETVAVNQGYPVRVFKDWDEAVEWLHDREGSLKSRDVVLG